MVKIPVGIPTKEVRQNTPIKGVTPDARNPIKIHFKGDEYM